MLLLVGRKIKKHKFMEKWQKQWEEERKGRGYYKIQRKAENRRRRWLSYKGKRTWMDETAVVRNRQCSVS